MQDVAHYELSDLPVNELGAAYPLIREIRNDVSLDGWIDHARDWLDIGAERGIKKLEQEGVMRGLFTYEIRRLAGQPPSLFVNHFVAMDILYGDEITEQLMSYLDNFMKANGCDCVDIEVGSVG